MLSEARDVWCTVGYENGIYIQLTSDFHLWDMCPAKETLIFKSEARFLRTRVCSTVNGRALPIRIKLIEGRRRRGIIEFEHECTPLHNHQ